ncbi:MAG TPA: zinc ABC transporter substrate-binding protein [Candidatus Egerieicola pullicola]|uniref:Zinc ABC transporter substrate-binding protein n=1 Tax=Candidatus Egerieicola pullicola TaxID=2840775 RepID=A0A9D1AJ52_9FIRM|nr:zinc ABC transporter substrate-binding protein [Candidatus Egerieicola pullicola]
MKRLLSLLLAGVLLLGALCGCSVPAKQEEGLSVVATIFPQYDFARQVMGSSDDLTMLLRPGQEVHSYEPTPQDIIAIQNCDLFIYVGGESDAWIEDVLEGMDTSHMVILSLMDLVDPLEEDTDSVLENPEEHSHEDGEATHLHEEEYDEHVWTSPKNAMLITQAICDALCDIDPSNAQIYRQNTAAYLEQLEELDQDFREVIGSASRDTLIFGDRFPLLYFVREYGLNYYAAFPGCASETEPSAATVARLIDLVREEQVPVVYQIELSNGNIARSIADSSGAKVETFYTCHNITRDDFNAGETYLSLMERNVNSLKEALN